MSNYNWKYTKQTTLTLITRLIIKTDAQTKTNNNKQHKITITPVLRGLKPHICVSRPYFYNLNAIAVNKMSAILSKDIEKKYNQDQNVVNSTGSKL